MLQSNVLWTHKIDSRADTRRIYIHCKTHPYHTLRLASSDRNSQQALLGLDSLERSSLGSTSSAAGFGSSHFPLSLTGGASHSRIKCATPSSSRRPSSTVQSSNIGRLCSSHGVYNLKCPRSPPQRPQIQFESAYNHSCPCITWKSMRALSYLPLQNKNVSITQVFLSASPPPLL